MRVKNIRKTRKSLHEAAEEFIAFKTARKGREKWISIELLHEAILKTVR